MMKEEAIGLVLEDATNFAKLSEQFRDDFVVCYAVLHSKKHAGDFPVLKYAGESIRKNLNFALEAVSTHMNNIIYVEDTLVNSSSFIAGLIANENIKVIGPLLERGMETKTLVEALKKEFPAFVLQMQKVNDSVSSQRWQMSPKERRRVSDMRNFLNLYSNLVSDKEFKKMIMHSGIFPYHLITLPDGLRGDQELFQYAVQIDPENMFSFHLQSLTLDSESKAYLLEHSIDVMFDSYFDVMMAIVNGTDYLSSDDKKILKGHNITTFKQLLSMDSKMLFDVLKSGYVAMGSKDDSISSFQATTKMETIHKRLQSFSSQFHVGMTENELLGYCSAVDVVPADLEQLERYIDSVSHQMESYNSVDFSGYYKLEQQYRALRLMQYVTIISDELSNSGEKRVVQKLKNNRNI